MRPPLAFRLARALIRRRMPGGWRMLAPLARSGRLQRVVRHELADGVSLDVPLWRKVNQWDLPDLLAYDPPLIDDLAAAAESLPRPLVFVDCGADIGTVTALLAARARLDRLIAFEPNAEAFPFLRDSLARLPGAEAHHAALADFAGRGELRSPPHDASDHAKYVAPAEPGDFPVRSIDSLGLAPDGGLLLKIDVEGGELAVLRGAEASLRASAGFAISFEAQREQAARTGIEPMEIVRFIEQIRPCEVTVSDLPGFRPDRERPFFSQIPDAKGFGYNLMCRSLQVL
jgi:FkbM family methyltransferase